MALDYGSSGAASSADDRAGARVDVDLHALTIAGGDLDLPDDHAPGGIEFEFDDDPGRVFHRGVNDLRDRHRGALDPLEMFGFAGFLLRAVHDLLSVGGEVDLVALPRLGHDFHLPYRAAVLALEGIEPRTFDLGERGVDRLQERLAVAVVRARVLGLGGGVRGGVRGGFHLARALPGFIYLGTAAAGEYEREQGRADHRSEGE